MKCSRILPLLACAQTLGCGSGDGDPRFVFDPSQLISCDDQDQPGCMVAIEAGTFLMGAQDENNARPGYDRRAAANEAPVHEVELSAYWIDRYEVTVSQYIACSAAGVCSDATECAWGDANAEDPAMLLHPIACVTWTDARAFCRWIGGDLPSEAQWERAARGTDGKIYPWGNAWDCEQANADDEELDDPGCVEGGCGCDGFDATAPVGRFPGGASADGVRDMIGNVWEWLLDYHRDDAYTTHEGLDPVNTRPAGDYPARSMRGGSWIDDHAEQLRASERQRLLPTDRLPYVGFRCIRPNP